MADKQIKFYNKFTPKEQNEKFGIIAVHFEPFEDMDYVWEQDHDTYTIEECQETLKEYCHSTIYQGFRYFFNSLENLKKFCEITEKGDFMTDKQMIIDGIDVSEYCNNCFCLAEENDEMQQGRYHE